LITTGEDAWPEMGLHGGVVVLRAAVLAAVLGFVAAAGFISSQLPSDTHTPSWIWWSRVPSWFAF
jgi:hypothetical protein